LDPFGIIFALPRYGASAVGGHFAQILGNDRVQQSVYWHIAYTPFREKKKILKNVKFC
jgi:hypothetical protein